MNEGDVAIIPVAMTGDLTRNRPVVLLKTMPPFGDWLVCAVSNQLIQSAHGFDDLIDPKHPDFKASGLKAASLIRLGFLSVLPASGMLGRIGRIAPERHRNLLARLGDHLRKVHPKFR